LEVHVKELEILTTEGHQLFLVKFFSKNSINQIIVISSATGVLQKYYSKFAQFFATKSFVVYTFDYHGIGNSGTPTSALKKKHHHPYRMGTK
jgi:predicted alpha/beta hydrolase